MGKGRDWGGYGRQSVTEKVARRAGQVQQEWETARWRVLSAHVLAAQGSCGLGSCCEACKATYTKDLCIARMCVYPTDGILPWIRSRGAVCAARWELCWETHILLSLSACAPSHVSAVRVSLPALSAPPCGGLDMGQEELPGPCTPPDSGACGEVQPHSATWTTEPQNGTSAGLLPSCGRGRDSVT